MDLKIRTTKTASGKTAVQIINYHRRRVNLIKHIGSGNTEADLLKLQEQARLWIEEETRQNGLFSRPDPFHQRYQYLGFRYLFAYEFLEKIYTKLDFQQSDLFKDLAIARILEPGSKSDSLDFLAHFLDKVHSENTLYKTIARYDPKAKERVEAAAVAAAKQHFGFDFSFVLYDVTTLYFESFKNDTFKCPGFSKDHKNNQPQVVIGLIVTKEGFPISYQVFKGNTFEGNTFLPTILDFKQKHQIESLTVVADSAMLSKQNLDTLIESGLNYIVGSRLANLKNELIDEIDQQIERVDGRQIRLGNLIVDFSARRYTKDKRELDKQIEKSKLYLNRSTEKLVSLKYLKNDKAKRYLNQPLIDKHTKLLGLKGYLTNLTEPNDPLIVSRYHELVKIEHAFRIAKSDLEARPIYHHKEDSIKNHLLICFMALTISAYLELKNHRSIASIVEALKSVTDAQILNKITQEVISSRSANSGQVAELEKLSY